MSGLCLQESSLNPILCHLLFIVYLVDEIHWFGASYLGWCCPPFHFSLPSFFFNTVSLLARAKKSILLHCSLQWRPLEKAATSVRKWHPWPPHSCRSSSHAWPADACPRLATEPPWQGCSAASGRLFTPSLISHPQRYGGLSVGRRFHMGRDCGSRWGLAWSSPTPPGFGLGEVSGQLGTPLCACCCVSVEHEHQALPTCCRQPGIGRETTGLRGPVSGNSHARPCPGQW